MNHETKELYQQKFTQDAILVKEEQKSEAIASQESQICAIED